MKGTGVFDNFSDRREMQLDKSGVHATTLQSEVTAIVAMTETSAQVNFQTSQIE